MTIDKHLVNTGMDTIFWVLADKDRSYQEQYLLKEWGNLTESEDQGWFRELQELGVRKTTTLGKSTDAPLPAMGALNTNKLSANSNNMQWLGQMLSSKCPKSCSLPLMHSSWL